MTLRAVDVELAILERDLDLVQQVLAAACRWLGTTSTRIELVGSPDTTMLPEAQLSMLMSTGSEHAKSHLVMAVPFCGVSAGI